MIPLVSQLMQKNKMFIFVFRIFTKILQTLKMEISCPGPKVECTRPVFVNTYLACYFNSLSRNFFSRLVPYLGNFRQFLGRL